MQSSPSFALDHQVALFKNAPRDYLNLGTLKSPYLVSYYIDESFHTTWVVRGRTKFKTLKGEDGLKFAISDHQFSLPKVEAVLISELPEYFRTTGPGVDIILGRDFLTTYSFLFFKRASGALQLSKSCINRCKWPDKSDRSIDFYTAWVIDKRDETKAGISAFVNICSPFSTWRSYKPCYWDPREDIGLSAMILAMKTATQMPALEPGPVINIITNDNESYETYSPFIEIQLGDVRDSKPFQNLSLRLQEMVVRLLQYRKTYADRNGLKELSCVHMINYQKQEHRKLYGFAKLQYAVQLAKLGAKMVEFDTKDPSRYPISSNHYYHFDNKTQVLAVPKKQVNKTLHEILQSYQQLNGTVPAGLSDYSPSGDETPVRGPTKAKIPAPDSKAAPKKDLSIPIPTMTPNTKERATYPHLPTEELSARGPTKETRPTPTSVPNTQTHVKHRHLVDFALEEELEKMQQYGLSFPGLCSILDRLKRNDLALYEKTAILNETSTQLQHLVKQSEERGLAITERQRRNCDVIMAGARKQQEDLAIGAALAAKHFKGVVEGYFIRASQEAAGQPTRGVVHPITVDPTPIHFPPKRHTYLGHTPENVDMLNIHEDAALVDPQKRLEKHRLAVEKLQQSGKLPRTSFSGDKIVAIDCRFIKSMEGAEGPARASNAHDISRRANENTERLRIKAAKSKLDSVETELAAKFSDIDQKFRDNRRRETGTFTRDTKARENFNEDPEPEPATVRIYGGAIWPSKMGRGQLFEMRNSGAVAKNQDHNRMESNRNPTVEPNTISKDTETEHKRPIQTNVKNDTKVETRKTQITTHKIGSHADESSHKIPTKYPEGAIGLANIGGIPGDRGGNDPRHNKFPDEDGSSFGEIMYAPWNTIDPKEFFGSSGLDSEGSSTNPERTTNDIPITNGVPINLTTDNGERPRIARGITPQQLAEMTELSPGTQRILNKPIGTLIDALVVSPELRKTTITAVNDALGGSFLSEDELILCLSGGLAEDQQIVSLTA